MDTLTTTTGKAVLTGTQWVTNSTAELSASSLVNFIILLVTVLSPFSRSGELLTTTSIHDTLERAAMQACVI